VAARHSRSSMVLRFALAAAWLGSGFLYCGQVRVPRRAGITQRLVDGR
jgi:hypothetical protein